MSLPVRPEFGPTLPELAGPSWRRLPRAARIALAVVAGVLIVVLIALSLRSSSAVRATVVRGTIDFNLVWDHTRLVRLQPQAGEELRLQTPSSDANPESYTVRPLTLPAGNGDAAGDLPVLASSLIEEMRRADPNFVLRSEGRTRVNDQPGYQIQWQTVQNGRTAYGRRSLIFPPDPGARQGADIRILAVRSPSMPNVDGVGSNGPTKLPYRSFRLGTTRP